MMATMMNMLLALRRFSWWLFRPQTRGVRAIIVNRNGEILLVRHSYGKGWYLPGGRVKRGENDQAALRRELHEEAGIEFNDPARLLGTYVNQQEYKRDTIAVFIVQDFRMTGMSDREVEAHAFFSPTHLPVDVSPGTQRRLEEWQGKTNITPQW